VDHAAAVAVEVARIPPFAEKAVEMFTFPGGETVLVEDVVKVRKLPLLPERGRRRPVKFFQKICDLGQAIVETGFVP